MHDIFEPFEAATADDCFVVAQLGQSLDGRIATSSGDSRYINGPAALDHLHAMRARVDAVVVGVGTAVQDDPMLTVRRVPGRSPARVVIDPSGRLPAGAKCLAGDGVRRILVRGERPVSDSALPAGVESIRCAGAGAIDPREILAALLRLGLRRILIEGGSRTVSDFIHAGCVDRLHVLVAPLIIGSGKPALEFAPIAHLSQALRPVARVHVLSDGDVLFDCDLRRGAGAPSR